MVNDILKASGIDANATIVAAPFFGWSIGFLLWLVQWLVISLPRTGGLFQKKGTKNI